jgi:transposase, IS6 family
VRWYLRYPLAYEHVAELLAERGIEVDASCIWRWVQAYSPELSKRCRPRLKRTNKSYHVDESYIKVKGHDKYLSGGRFDRTDHRLSTLGQVRHNGRETVL